MTDHQVLIVGGGHNGLVCACYLARQGVDVLVLEQSDRPGGGARTEETVPGHRFDTHSVAHNIINMTDIPEELDLAGAGLRYVEMDPFAMAAFTDGRIVRFHRDVTATVASIAEHSEEEAAAYDAFIGLAAPVIDTVVGGVQAGATRRRTLRRLPGRAAAALTALRRADGPTGLAHTLVSPYDRLLRDRLVSDLTRAPVAAFAAHAGATPTQTGTALFALWQAGWERAAAGFAERMIDTVAARVPGFRATVVGMALRTPAQMARELAWPGAHPMVLDITPDQLAWMRPLPRLGAHDTPVRGLFLSGAGSAPVGGVAGTPGRATARRILARHGRPTA